MLKSISVRIIFGLLRTKIAMVEIRQITYTQYRFSSVILAAEECMIYIRAIKRERERVENQWKQNKKKAPSSYYVVLVLMCDFWFVFCALAFCPVCPHRIEWRCFKFWPTKQRRRRRRQRQHKFEEKFTHSRQKSSFSVCFVVAAAARECEQLLRP